MKDPIIESIKAVFPDATIVDIQPAGDPIYQNYLKFPPKFYCKAYSGGNAERKYCTHQCDICTGIVTSTREKNSKLTQPK